MNSKNVIEIFSKIRDCILAVFFPPRCILCKDLIWWHERYFSVCPKCAAEMNRYVVRGNLCLKCGKPIGDSDEEYCRDCRRRKRHFAAGRAVFLYTGNVRKCMHRFKYSGIQRYGEPLAAWTNLVLGDWIKRINPDVIVAVPVSKKRYRERGYNQAEVFGKYLSKETGIPLQKGAVIRKKHTAPQKNLGVADRKKNLEDAFTTGDNSVKLKRVLLVDDIYTTGATTDAVSQVLLDAGADDVFVLCICIGGVMEVRACKICRKLFNYMSGAPICPACKDALEAKFVDVKDYIREHHHCSLNEVAEAMDIPPQQIKQWVKEDRLQFSDAAASGIFCDRCGEPIVSGRYCKSCMGKVVGNLEKGIEMPKEDAVKKTTHDNKMRFLQ